MSTRCSTYEGDKTLGRTPDEKRPHGIIMHRWKDNIKMDLREIRFGV
jgi:hypothetical protein